MLKRLGKFSVNLMVRPRPMFEIRYNPERFRTRILFGLHANLYGLYVCIYPFTFSITMSRKITPTKLTPEEVAELKLYDEDL